MKYILLCLLSACSISYYYKGKDLEKNQTKLNRELDKSIKQFDKVKESKAIYQQLLKSSVKPAVQKSFATSIDKCISYQDQVIQLKKERNIQYKQLKIQRKKNYQEKDKNYPKIKAYIESHQDFEAKANKLFKEIKQVCNKPSEILKDEKLKLLDAKAVYNSFQKHKKELTKTDVKIKNSLRKFEKKLKLSNHKNKKKIFKELAELKTILKKIKSQNALLDMEITKLEKAYGKKGKILIAPGTQAFKSTTFLEEQISQYNQIIKEYDKQIKVINKLVKA